MGHAAGMPAMMQMPMMSAQEGRLDQHVRILGMVWCLYAAWRLIATHTFFLFGSTHHHLFFVVLALLAGFGLLTRRSWARKLSLILGVLSLFNPPVGTALGVYTLWVLGSRAARAQWRLMQVHYDRY